MKSKVFLLCCSLCLGFGGLFLYKSIAHQNGNDENHQDLKAPSAYPVARRNESVKEFRPGIEIADPYRWLEDPYSAETKQFISAQNQLSDSYLRSSDIWPKIHEKLTQTYNFEKYTLPQYHGYHYYFQMNTGLQHQNVIYKKKSLDGEPSVFLDPNQIAADGTIAITSFAFSPNAKMVAYSYVKSGSDWNKLKIRNVETGEDYPETLVGLKFSTTTWTSDSKGFFYNRYLKVGDGTETDRTEYQKVYYHRVGEAQEKDVLVIEFLEHPLSIVATANPGEYLILHVLPNGNNNQHHLYYVNLKEHGEINGKLPLTPIYTEDLSCEFALVTINGSKVAFQTNKDAPNYRIIWIDLENPAVENWTTLIEEHPKDYLMAASHIGGKNLLTVYLHDVKSVLQLRNLDTGELIREIPLGMGAIGGIGLDATKTEILYLKTSFLSPGTIYQYNFTDPNAEPSMLYKMKPGSNEFKKEDLEVEQVFYRSRDGTRIPMFIVQKRTTKNKPGPKPTLLYGYGGFRIPITLGFSLDWFFFVNSFDGILAVANIRGGGEYGTKWHLDGILFNKQNSYDDFHAAAEHLIGNGYTTPNKLAIRGLSNGGLLVGTSINQRPELYGAAISQVGVYDMIRYPLFTYPAATIPEYGDPEKQTDFENILKYSPLHNIHTPNSTQTRYPATFIITGDHDDRVSPLHSFKFAAALQHAVQGNEHQNNPILLRLLKDVGHSGKPTYKLIDQETDVMTFLYRALSIETDL